jgi:endonuclease G
LIAAISRRWPHSPARRQQADTNVLSNITPHSSALNQGSWVKLEDRERDPATRLAVPVYVLTGPLYERMMRPLPNRGDYQRVPSGYWKVVVLADGRATAFMLDQSDPRSRDVCTARVTIRLVELRSQLGVFPDATAAAMPLDTELGSTSAVPADPVLRAKRRPKRADAPR